MPNLIRLAHSITFQLTLLWGLIVNEEDANDYLDNIVNNPRFEYIKLDMQMIKNEIEALKGLIENKDRKIIKVDENKFIEIKNDEKK